MLNNLFTLRRRLLRKFYIPYNRYKLIAFGVKVARGCLIYNKFYVEISANANISIGENFTLTSGDSFNPLCKAQRASIYVEENASLQIGNNVGASSPTIWVKNEVFIGNNVKIGGDSIIMDTDCHCVNYLSRRDPKIDGPQCGSSPIVIEDDVLIGTRCIILKGVTIGARSIIAAGSVVTKSIPSDSIAAGNPAKVVRILK